MVLLAFAFGNLSHRCFAEEFVSNDGWTVGTPIVMYWGDGKALTDARAEEAAVGGYNVVWITAVAQAKMAEQKGLRTILMHPLLSVDSLDGGSRQASLDALIDAYQKSPAAYAYLIADEPPLPMLTGLGRLVEYIRLRDPGHLSYINIFPLPSYVEEYMPAVKPSLLSQDYYQFKSDHDSTGYLQNLQYTSQTAKAAGGIPFMNVVQAVAFDDKWRVPGAGELRFLNYSTLAYGAEGIHYFLYGPTSPPASGGLIDTNGTPTSVYDALKPLNGEFVEVATELQPLNFIGAYLKGYEVNPPEIPSLPASSPFNISGVASTLTYTAGDPLKGILLGLFNLDGKTLEDATFVVVVNNDYTTEKTYTLSGPGPLSVFNASTGQWIASGKNEVSITLAKGGGILVGLSSDVDRVNKDHSPPNT